MGILLENKGADLANKLISAARDQMRNLTDEDIQHFRKQIAIAFDLECKQGLFENDMGGLGKDLASLIKKGAEEEMDLNEALGVLSILSWIIASTTFTNLMAKWTGKLFAKYKFGQGEQAAKKIYDYTHKLEDDFKKPIRLILKPLIRDPKQREIVTNVLFALLIITLGAKAGKGAVTSLMKGKTVSGSVSSLKAALKGKDLQVLIKDILKASK